MKIKSSESVRVYRTQGGCSRILAIPFIAIGSSLLYFGILVLYRSKETIQIVVASIACLMGGIILSMAIPIISTREGVTLDRIQGTATRWRTIFGRYKALAVHNLNEFRSIEIYNKRQPGRRMTTHIIELTGDSKKLIICNLALIEQAQETATDASVFMSLPLIDKTKAEDEFSDGPP